MVAVSVRAYAVWYAVVVHAGNIQRCVYSLYGSLLSRQMQRVSELLRLVHCRERRWHRRLVAVKPTDHLTNSLLAINPRREDRVCSNYTWEVSN